MSLAPPEHGLQPTEVPPFRSLQIVGYESRMCPCYPHGGAPTAPNKGMKQTKPAQAMELRSLSPVLGEQWRRS